MLTFIRILHTVVWALFVALILVLPVLGWFGHFGWALFVIGVVLLEGVVLLVNGWRCPLTSMAARYTEDRRDGFDIYLPEWLARNNKAIFTTVFLLGTGFVLWRWIVA